MNEEMEVFDNEDFTPEGSSKRPTFILVLAILSWIYVGIGLIGQIGSMFGDGEAERLETERAIATFEATEGLDEEYKEEMVEFLEVSMEKKKPMGLMQLVLLLIEGMGVFLMFQLKKVGYVVYTISQIGFILLPFIFFPLDNFATTTSIITIIVLVGIFQVLYGVNLKHMKA